MPDSYTGSVAPDVPPLATVSAELLTRITVLVVVSVKSVVIVIKYQVSTASAVLPNIVSLSPEVVPEPSPQPIDILSFESL